MYRAWDTRLDREVALKLIDVDPAVSDGSSSSIIHEGRLLARVRHPNVVTIYGAEQIGARIGLWMEFVRGRTLKQIVDDGRVFSEAEAVAIGIDVAHAVAAVHSAGVLHRDIKAQNVMLADDGRAVLMDFGTGRELADNFSSDVAGTPLYLAPEILAGGDATVQSDIYSLGVLLYYLVTGSYPVRAETLSDLRLAHQRNERVSIRTARGRSDLPPKLARIIERAIDPRPDRRYASADALAADLATLQPRPTLARLPYAIAAAAVLLLIAGLGWEAVGRRVGSSRTPGVLLAGVAGWNAGGAGDVIPSQPIIAVLPFKNLSDEPGSGDFVDGLTDEIIRNLGGIQGLQVRSRDSSFTFKNKPRDLRDVGQQLGVNLVVDGSVLRSGNKLRINAQLILVAGGCPPVDRAVRSGAQGHLCHSGRHLAGDRQQAATDAWQRTAAIRDQCGGVRAVPQGQRAGRSSRSFQPQSGRGSVPTGHGEGSRLTHPLMQGWRSRMRSWRCLAAAHPVRGGPVDHPDSRRQSARARSGAG